MTLTNECGLVVYLDPAGWIGIKRTRVEGREGTFKDAHGQVVDAKRDTSVLIVHPNYLRFRDEERRRWLGV